MSKLVQHAIQTCRSMDLKRMYVEASICAKPLFEKNGFTVIREKEVVIKGVPLKNYDMELRLS